MIGARPTDSIFRRLLVGLGLVAVAVSLLLLAAVFINYHLTFQDLSSGNATEFALYEVREHVLMPALLFPIPAALAVIVVVRRALAPLDRAVLEMTAIKAGERGYRLGAATMPAEFRPFAESVNALLTRLEDAAALQEDFAADVAHELRTPLALMKLEVERLGKATPGSDALVRLSGDIEALARLVDQLFVLAQIKAEGSAGIPRAEVNLGEIARATVAALAPVAIGKGRTMSLVVNGEAASVWGWREAIAAALRNLAENAIEATPPGTEVRVIVGPGRRLAVADHGSGLDPEELRELSHRHARGEATRYGGAGLGLAIVTRIMETHGGVVRTDQTRRAVILDFQGSPLRVRTTEAKAEPVEPLAGRH